MHLTPSHNKAVLTDFHREEERIHIVFRVGAAGVGVTALPIEKELGARVLTSSVARAARIQGQLAVLKTAIPNYIIATAKT